MGGILVVLVALIVLGGAALVAFGFLLAQRTRVARIVLASGFLGAVLIAALGVLTFLGREYRQGESAATFVVIAASLCLAGAGQFVGALRNGQTFAAAFGCSAVSLLLVSAPLFGSDWGVELVREGLTERLPFAVLVSLLPALASVGIAIFLPVPARPMESARPATDGRTSPADQGDRPSSTAFRDKTSGLRE